MSAAASAAVLLTGNVLLEMLKVYEAQKALAAANQSADDAARIAALDAQLAAATKAADAADAAANAALADKTLPL